jgi:hypothetical protein
MESPNMNDSNRPIDKLMWVLRERTKELNCLYRIEESLRDPDCTLELIFQQVIEALPAGFQYPEVCRAVIEYGGSSFHDPDFHETPWTQSSDIVVQGEAVGRLSVYYQREIGGTGNGLFLLEEATLLATVANRLGHFIRYRSLREMHHELQTVSSPVEHAVKPEWRVVVDLLRCTDQSLYRRVIHKLFVRLRSSGVSETELGTADSPMPSLEPLDDNRPVRKRATDTAAQLGDHLLDVASMHFSDQDVLGWIQKWIQEDRSGFLVAALESHQSSLNQVADAVRRFYRMTKEGVALSPATEKEVRVSLIQRFFTEQLEYVTIAKKFVEVSDFYQLVDRIVFQPDSHGKLGGKSAGLFIACRVISKLSQGYDVFRNIRTPSTWHIPSDALLSFIAYNGLDELLEHKYRDSEEIRGEYSHIVQVFKHSSFPPDIVQGLALALDSFNGRPVIVRSSSLLEDRFGSAFSGKYKSLFLANQGNKEKNLEALLDAIAEVYASIFSPDAIQYRTERGLLDFREEMGIMIQEVVGTQIGRYFLPAFAGVAFSNNEFRWSPRIRREDGLIRLVPGLGTRAVDRLSDDYPVLIAAGQPGLRVNVSVDEMLRYAPNKMDVINLETNSFETIEVETFFREYGQVFPKAPHIVSVCRDGHVFVPSATQFDPQSDQVLVTFEGLLKQTFFARQLKTMLDVLQKELGTPVDIEFASDGQDLYLLQCRPQSNSQGATSTPIPRDIPQDQIIFTANRFVSNGKVPEITHIVYVDPESYSEIHDLSTLTSVGRAVGRLNALLPKQRFILMGPGRWGSRGDIKLGVNVSYSDIKDTAVLIEIARKKGNYVPDLSFGTHFFQDLVESSIGYLPLYPDDRGVIFNEDFLRATHNSLPELIPDYTCLADTLRVVDVPHVTGGLILRVLMNAELDEAIAFLAAPGGGSKPE